jgi:hypothetical protein
MIDWRGSCLSMLRLLPAAGCVGHSSVKPRIAATALQAALIVTAIEDRSRRCDHTRSHCSPACDPCRGPLVREPFETFEIASPDDLIGSSADIRVGL